MEYIEAGKFIKKKRKSVGYKTQKSFIKALTDADPDINCSESYISLIESGVKSPSVHLLDVMSNLLKLTPQEKGELLLIYKRVPSDFEFAVRNNIKEHLKLSNVDKLKRKYEDDKNKKNLNNLTRALVLEGDLKQALDLLQTAPNFSSNLIDYQDRTAKIAAISGNYDFAIQAFELALKSCGDDYSLTKAEMLMHIGICYFAKALQSQHDKPLDSLDLLLLSKKYLTDSLSMEPEYIYCIDEFARCLYHIADSLDYFRKTKTNIIPEKSHQNILEWFDKEGIKKQIKFDSDLLLKQIKEYFEEAVNYYKKILSHSEKGDLPEKALKEAVYFHAYSYCKLKLFDEALLLINSILILDQNWLTYFLKAGYFLLKYEFEKNEKYIDESLEILNLAFDYDPESVKDLLKAEKNRELKTLYEKRPKEFEKLLKKEIQEAINV